MLMCRWESNAAHAPCVIAGAKFNINTFQSRRLICRELTARQQHVESLPVRNWLPKAQRFTVTVAREPPASVPAATTITAPTHVDVPALADKLIKIAITPHAPAPVRTAVTCTNEATGEYVFYNLEYTVKEGPAVATVALSAPVRTRVRKSIALHNPLPHEVTVSGACTAKSVQFPAHAALQASGTTTLDVSYMPLLATAQEATLSYKSAELGSQDFKLQLSGQPTAADSTLTFGVVLGQAETRTAALRNFCPVNTTYAVKLSAEGAAEGWSTPATLAAPAAPEAGAPLELPVTYQPTAVCEASQHSVTLTSPEGGVYECLLVGRCTPPTPQGPVRVPGGKGATVPFLNPFKADAEFRYCCDNPSFALKPSESIKAGATANIAVAYKEVPGKGKTGMLTVTCPSRTTCQWVFYLEAQ